MTALSSQRLLDFADIFGKGKPIPVAPRSGRRLIARGELGVVRIGGRCFVPEEELERFLADRFTPARSLRQAPDPQAVEKILDRVAPRYRAEKATRKRRAG